MKRRTIPILKKKANQKGCQFIAARNFPYGNEFIRLYQGSVHTLHVAFRPKTPKLLVMLHSNISGEWADYEFEKTGDLEYSLDLHCSRPGAFHFKVKYSLNHGKTWCWDNVPHTSLMVDSASMKNIRLYTLIPTVSGHIGNWISELDRIKKLGFNAVHLLPVTPLDAAESPYAASELFDLDPSYSIPGDIRPVLDQFEAFVEKAKKLGIKLCFDVVLNHIGVSSKVCLHSPDWIVSSSDEPDGFKRAGYWHNLNWIEWPDLALIKYDHPNKAIRKEIWDYMSEYLLFWANYANYTGGLIRLDNLHSTNRDFLDFAIGRLRSEFPDLIVFAELFTDLQTTQKMVFFHGLNLLLATPWINSYAEAFRNYISSIHANPKVRYLVPVNSHDSGTPAQEYGSPMAAVPRYAACALLGGGHTGLVQGAEFGAPEKIPFIGRGRFLSMEPQTWGLDFSAEICAINKYVAENDFFAESGNIQFVDGNHGAVLGAIRYNKSHRKIALILISFDTQSYQNISISFDLPIFSKAKKIVLQNRLSNEEDIILSDKFSAFTLAPCDVKVFEVHSK